MTKDDLIEKLNQIKNTQYPREFNPTKLLAEYIDDPMVDKVLRELGEML
jgi:hypothetical protein